MGEKQVCDGGGNFKCATCIINHQGRYRPVKKIQQTTASKQPEANDTALHVALSQRSCAKLFPVAKKLSDTFRGFLVFCMLTMFFFVRSYDKYFIPFDFYVVLYHQIFIVLRFIFIIYVFQFNCTGMKMKEILLIIYFHFFPATLYRSLKNNHKHKKRISVKIFLLRKNFFYFCFTRRDINNQTLKSYKFYLFILRGILKTKIEYVFFSKTSSPRKFSLYVRSCFLCTHFVFSRQQWWCYNYNHTYILSKQQPRQSK